MQFSLTIQKTFLWNPLIVTGCSYNFKESGMSWKLFFTWQSVPIFRFVGYIQQNLFGKTNNWRQMYIKTSLTVCISNSACLQNNLSKEEILATWYLANLKTFLFINLSRFTTLNAYGIANRVNQKKIKNLLKSMPRKCT